jgi:hypothetical protein
LIRDSSHNRLPDPLNGICAELEALAMVELLYSMHQANIPLLNEIEEGQATSNVLSGYTNNQAQIGFHEMLARSLGSLPYSLKVTGEIKAAAFQLRM